MAQKLSAKLGYLLRGFRFYSSGRWVSEFRMNLSKRILLVLALRWNLHRGEAGGRTSAICLLLAQTLAFPRCKSLGRARLNSCLGEVGKVFPEGMFRSGGLLS